MLASYECGEVCIQTHIRDRPWSQKGVHAAAAQLRPGRWKMTHGPASQPLPVRLSLVTWKLYLLSSPGMWRASHKIGYGHYLCFLRFLPHPVHREHYFCCHFSFADSINTTYGLLDPVFDRADQCFCLFWRAGANRASYFSKSTQVHLHRAGIRFPSIRIIFHTLI